MNTTGLAMGLASALALVAPAFAGHADGPYEAGGFLDYAKVERVEPLSHVVRVATPRRECWTEEVPVYRSGYRSATPLILGGIVGGVVGNTVGQGRGRDVATVAGALLGGSVGRDVAQRNGSTYAAGTEVRERCRVVDDYRDEERIDGYRVTYRYQGEQYVTHLDHDPGERLRIQVSVAPAE